MSLNLSSFAPLLATGLVVLGTTHAQDAAVDATSGRYELDPAHSFLTFAVGYAGGLASYRMDFTDFDAVIDLDAEALEASSVTVSVDPMGVAVNYPLDYRAGHQDSPYSSWPEDLSRSPRFLHADEYPEVKFASTSVERTGQTTGRITGNLTFRGVTRPISMDAGFNGVRSGREGDRIGFDAHGTFKRSDFGSDFALGYISDEVELSFTGIFVASEAEER